MAKKNINQDKTLKLLVRFVKEKPYLPEEPEVAIKQAARKTINKKPTPLTRLAFLITLHFIVP